MIFGILENPTETGVTAIITALVTSGVHAFAWWRREKRTETTTAIKEWQDYARQQRIDSRKKDRRIEKLERDHEQCLDQHRKALARIEFLEKVNGIDPPADEETADELRRASNTEIDHDDVE